jgi:hypothetical protein
MIGSGPARRVGLGVRLLGREIELLAVEGLSVDQVVSHREHGGLDGRIALSPSAFCLPFDGTGWIEPLRDIQSYGTPSAAWNHDSSNDRDLVLWTGASRHARRGRLAYGMDLGKTCAGCCLDTLSFFACSLARGVFCGLQSAFDAFLPHDQRASDGRPHRDRCARCG